MAWNGSDRQKVKVGGQDQERKILHSSTSNINYKWLLAGLIVVLGGGLVAYFILARSETSGSTNERTGRPSKIAEVKAAVVTNRTSETSAKKAPKLDPDIISIERRVHPVTGEYVLVTQRVVKVPANASYIGREFPNNPIKRPKKLYNTFSENYIVGLMRTQPGYPVVGMTLPKNFDEEFKARIADPVGIQEDDSDEDIAIREQMVSFKREMAQLIADGHTPTEIVLSERKEMNRIADIRSNYIRIISDMKKEGASQEEVQDMVDAANKLLDQNGGAHIKFVTPFTINAQKEGN